MEDSFKGLLFGFILVSLFGTLILVAIQEEGNLYGKDTTAITGGSLNLMGFNQTSQNIQSTSENLREKFEKQSVWSVVAGVVVSGIFDIAKTMTVMIITPFTLVSNILINVLHIPILVVNVILGLLILSIIFAVWSLIKIGN